MPHWEQFVERDPARIRAAFDRGWEAHGVENFFGASKNGMYMTNSFWSMRSPYFPREYAEKFVQHWAMDKEKGFYGGVLPARDVEAIHEDLRDAGRSFLRLYAGHRLLHAGWHVCSGLGRRARADD